MTIDRYYKDSDKLTFDEGEKLVKQFIREYGSRHTHVKSKHVAMAYGIERSHHNLIRLSEGLEKYLTILTESGSKTTVYEMTKTENTKDATTDEHGNKFSSETASEAAWKKHRDEIMTQFGLEEKDEEDNPKPK